MAERALVALVSPEDEALVLGAPAVGIWRDGPPAGALVRGGFELGSLEILGLRHRLIAPPEALGTVAPHDTCPRAVEYGSPLLRLEPLTAEATTTSAAAAREASTRGHVFPSPLSGRFYDRPSPEAPPFVSVGDEVQPGRTVGLLEVMKTFHRIEYGGAGLPARARVLAILPSNAADVDLGDPILQVEPIEP